MPRRKKSNHMVTNDIVNQIIAYSGEFKKPLQIARLIQPLISTTTPLKTIARDISNIVQKHKERINYLKEEYTKSILEVPIAHKRVRLDRLEDLYDKAYAADDLDASNKMLRSAREEVEGPKVNINLLNMSFLGNLTDEQIAEREKKVVEGIRALTSGKGGTEKEEGVSVLPATQQAEIISSK